MLRTAGFLLPMLLLVPSAAQQCGEQVLTSPNASTNDAFGIAIGVTGDTVLIGASRDDGLGDQAGAVFEYRLVGGSWVYTSTLVGSDTAAGDLFGVALHVDGTRALVGAPKHGTSGTVYVFEQLGGVWQETGQLTVAGIGTGAFFGAAIGLEGSVAVIGAPRAAPGQAGLAFVFEDSGAGFALTETLTPSMTSFSARFGSRVSLEGNAVAISAPVETIGAAEGAGAVYLFGETNGTWVETQRIPSPVLSFVTFGDSISLSGDRLAVGHAPFAGGSQDDLWIFERSASVWSLTHAFTKESVATSTMTPSLGQAVLWDGDSLFASGVRVSQAPGGPSGGVFAFRPSGQGWAQAGMLPHDPSAGMFLGVSLAAHPGGLFAGAETTAALSQSGFVTFLPHQVPDIYCTPKITSGGCEPRIFAQGVAGRPWYELHASAPNNTTGLLFYGFSSLAIPFFGGTLCVQPPLLRTTAVSSGGNPPPSDCSGELVFDLGGWIDAGGGGQGGDTVFAQFWFRDTNDPDKVGLSDALTFEICP